jgi:hypothetical protein
MDTTTRKSQVISGRAGSRRTQFRDNAEFFSGAPRAFTFGAELHVDAATRVTYRQVSNVGHVTLNRIEIKTAIRFRASDIFDQIPNPHVQCRCDDQQGSNGRALLAGFDTIQVNTVQPGLLSKFVLVPAFFLA